MDKTTELIRELGRCDSTSPLTRLDNWMEHCYAGITLEQGVETYEKKLNDLFLGFRMEVITAVSTMANGNRREFIESLIGTFNEIPDNKGFYPTVKDIDVLMRDNTIHDVKIKHDIEILKFERDMHLKQKGYQKEAILFLEGLLKEKDRDNVVDSVDVEPVPKEVETQTQNEEEVVDGKEASRIAGVAYNNIKSKKWRDDNHFPYRQAGLRAKVYYYRSEIIQWIDSKK